MAESNTTFNKKEYIRHVCKTVPINVTTLRFKECKFSYLNTSKTMTLSESHLTFLVVVCRQRFSLDENIECAKMPVWSRVLGEGARRHLERICVTGIFINCFYLGKTILISQDKNTTTLNFSAWLRNFLGDRRLLLLNGHWTRKRRRNNRKKSQYIWLVTLSSGSYVRRRSVSSTPRHWVFEGKRNQMGGLGGIDHCERKQECHDLHTGR